MTYICIGEKINIRHMEEIDLTDAYCSWLNDPAINKYLESRYQTWTINTLKEYFHKTKNSEILLAILDKETGNHIGNIKIGGLDKKYQRAELGLLIGDKNFWGKGYASEAIKLTSEYCFSKLHLHKITAGAYAENKASIQAFLKNDFVIEGERKEHYLINGYWTSLILLGKINKSNKKG